MDVINLELNNEHICIKVLLKIVHYTYQNLQNSSADFSKNSQKRRLLDFQRGPLKLSFTTHD